MATLNDTFLRLVSDSKLSDADFEKRSKVKRQNISAYRGGAKIGPLALLKACENFYGWPVVPIQEIKSFSGDFSKIPNVGGIYVLYDSAGNVVYFGKATNLRTEVRQTYRRASSYHTRLGPNLTKTQHTFGALTKYLSLYQIDNPRIRKNLEALLLRIFPNQTLNHNLGHFS